MVFLFAFITIIVLVISLIFSKIRIQIIDFRFHSQLQRHLNKDCEIVIKLYVLGCVPIFKINITKTKLEKIKNMDLKLPEYNFKFDKKFLKAIQKLSIVIKNINLHIDIGTENASLTAIIVPLISAGIAIILRKTVKKFENQIFKIYPIYTNQNLLNIELSSIFEIKMRHIISIIYMLSKKEKKGVNDYERTSHRGSYDYSYE